MIALVGQTDARLDNWWCVVPDDAPALTLTNGGRPRSNDRVPARTVSALDEALAAGPYPAVAAPDLSGWAAALRLRPDALVDLLARAVAPGGWIFAGMVSPYFPLRPGAPGSLSVRRAEKVLVRAGLHIDHRWLLLPSIARPAYLVPADRRAEFDYFLRHIFFPHVEARTPSTARLTRLSLQIGARAALVAPSGVRRRYAPAAAVLASRP